MWLIRAGALPPLLLVAAGGACADEGPRWGVELKRQNTGRGTPEEQTRTTLRFESYATGPFVLVRLDLPFPDAKQDFGGSPFDPRLGDIKLRADPQPLRLGDVPWTPRVELTMPTANPDSLGARKWQLGLGARTSGPLAQQFTYGLLLQQNLAVAGASDAKDINNTKAELEVLDTWASGHSLKFTLKPVVDWVMDGQTGAVAEIEGGRRFANGWRWTLMGGLRAWGPAVAGTYGKRIELTVGHRF
ncbi:hypothetical protein HHL11_05445 [Ramlibacter sp. G-1-2-2]|uniref:Transporter n=1 Tax=Ramlibacter agri TaxID=2728837 RepID=A0A848GWZ7_9BURK|nr:hypothetical protein [Ramlibacter agri]NML43186.1 hypothetical protein [Ramlibacter agri]